MSEGPYHGIKILACEVRDYLLATLPLKARGTVLGADGVEVRGDAEPPTHAGETFISIHGFKLERMGVKGNYSAFGVSFMVTLSVRTANLLEPARQFVRDDRGIYEWIDRLVGALDNAPAFLSAAHAKLDSTESLLPGKRVDASPVESPRERMGSWWGAGQEGNTKPAGFSQSIRVSGIEYYRLP